jgi:hypothetical protein
MNKKIGKITIPGDVNVMVHEYNTARALSNAGYNVKFIRASEREREHSADAYVDNEKWEFKAPTSGKLSAIEDNLKKASKQSNKIAFDSRRMKRLPDKAIMRELIAKSHASKSIVCMRFINRHGQVTYHPITKSYPLQQLN